MLRLVRHFGGSGWAAECFDALVEEVLGQTAELCREEFGKHVLLEFLEHGLPSHRHKIVEAMLPGLHRNAKHRHASRVIEKVFVYCDEEDIRAIADELLENSKALYSLVNNEFGRHVLLALAQSFSPCAHQALLRLSQFSTELKGSKQGRRLLDLMAPASEGSAQTQWECVWEPDSRS